MGIKCCNGCVAPKRHTGCHGHCLEYIKERAELDEQNEAERKKNAISYGITAQRNAGVAKATKRKKIGFYYAVKGSGSR